MSSPGPSRPDCKRCVVSKNPTVFEVHTTAVLRGQKLQSLRNPPADQSRKREREYNGEENDAKKECVKKPRFSVPNFMTMSFEIVNISVGKLAVTIPVYKDLICSVAPYFRGAFKYAFREAEEGVITLPDVEEHTFRIFLRWCQSHSQNVHIGEDRFNTDAVGRDEGKDSTGVRSDRGKSKSSSTCFDEFQNHWPQHLGNLTEDERDERYYANSTWISHQAHIHVSLLKLYIFADKYSVDQLRDDVLPALIGHCNYWEWWPDGINIVNHAYDNLPSTSPFLRLLVLSHCYSWTPPDSVDDLTKLESWHHKYLLDVVIASSRREQDPAPGETDKTKAVPKRIEDGLANSCLFHEHLAFDKQECRERLARCTYIFKDLMNMCIEQAEMASSNN